MRGTGEIRRMLIVEIILACGSNIQYRLYKLFC